MARNGEAADFIMSNKGIIATRTPLISLVFSVLEFSSFVPARDGNNNSFALRPVKLFAPMMLMMAGSILQLRHMRMLRSAHSNMTHSLPSESVKFSAVAVQMTQIRVAGSNPPSHSC